MINLFSVFFWAVSLVWVNLSFKWECFDPLFFIRGAGDVKFLHHVPACEYKHGWRLETLCRWRHVARADKLWFWPELVHVLAGGEHGHGGHPGQAAQPVHLRHHHLGHHASLHNVLLIVPTFTLVLRIPYLDHVMQDAANVTESRCKIYLRIKPIFLSTWL